MRAASEARYLDTWTPRLARVDSSGGDPPASSGRLLIEALRAGDPESVRSLRERFRPKRVVKRMFLPGDLSRVPSGEVAIPIVTDIDSDSFFRELEGAIDTHWNRSPWGRRNKLRFKILWTRVPKDLAFAAGLITLREHLAKFRDGPAILTTGGATIHVLGRALILGPAPVDARTLAHEFGHLLGFEDCYFRTLSGQGIFGLAVLEWANPFFPDELMCDDTVGVARALAW